MIPKRIYYVWLGKNKLPQNIKDNIQSWRTYNPDYEIIEINESNYDINKFDFIKEAYAERKWAFASDVVRLDILCQNGGFYFDTDVKLLKPLDSLRSNKSIWAMENSGEVNSGLVIGAQKGDDDLKALLDIYKSKHFVNDSTTWFDLITTNIISDYFYTKGLKIKNKKQILKNGTVIFPNQYFAPLHWWGGGKISKKSYAVQQYNNSWGVNNGQISSYRKFKYNLKLYCPSMYYLIINTHKKLLGKE